MSISDLLAEDVDPDFEYVVVLVNANDEAQSFTAVDLAGLDLQLHDVQANSVDPVVQTSSYDLVTGGFEVPGRTTAVFVVKEILTPSQMIDALIADVEALVDAGELGRHWGNWLIDPLEKAQAKLEKGKDRPALAQILNFKVRVLVLEVTRKLDHDTADTLIESAREIYLAILAE